MTPKQERILTRQMFDEINLSMLPKPTLNYQDQKRVDVMSDELMFRFVEKFVNAFNGR